MLQILVRHMVLVPCLAVNGPLHKGLLRYIQLSQTVDYDMDMNISAAIVTVHVGADQRLMSRKICFCIFQSKLLRPFSRQTIFCTVARIEADDVMVAFDFILVFVLLVLAVQLLTGRIERIRFTVQAVQIKLIPHDTIAVFVQYRSFTILVMFEDQIFQCSTIVGTLTCDVL